MYSHMGRPNRSHAHTRRTHTHTTPGCARGNTRRNEKSRETASRIHVVTQVGGEGDGSPLRWGVPSAPFAQCGDEDNCPSSVRAFYDVPQKKKSMLSARRNCVSGTLPSSPARKGPWRSPAAHANEVQGGVTPESGCREAPGSPKPLRLKKGPFPPYFDFQS